MSLDLPATVRNSTSGRLTRAACSIALITVAALLVRFLALWIFVRHAPLTGFQPVQSEVGCVARAVASGEGYSSPFPALRTGPTAWVPPVYTLLLAGLYKILGVYSRQAYLAALALNCIFAALAVIPLVHVGRRLVGDSAAVVGAWVWAVFPGVVYMPVKWLWETSLSALLLLWAMESALRMAEEPTPRRCALYGAVSGLCALTNPAIFLPLLLLGLWAVYSRRKDWRQWFGPACTGALVFALVVAPWTVRNFLVFGKWIPTRSNFGVEFFLGNDPESVDSWAFWLHPSENPAELARYAAIGEIAYCAEKQQQALAFVRHQPARFVMLSLNRFVWFWTGTWDALPDVWSGGGWRHSFDITSYAALGLAGLLGTALNWRRDAQRTLPVALVFLTYPLVYYITHPILRFRHPIDSLLILMAVGSFMAASAGRAASVHPHQR